MNIIKMMSAVLFLSLVYLFIFFFFVKSNNEFGWCVFFLDLSIVALMKFRMLKLHVNHFMQKVYCGCCSCYAFKSILVEIENIQHIFHICVCVCLLFSVQCTGIYQTSRRWPNGHASFFFLFWDRKGSQKKIRFTYCCFIS